MDTRRLGGLDVPVVGLGCNNFGSRIDQGATAAVVAAALDAGVTFFDTADIYGGGRSEEYLGRALGPRRADVLVATKFGHRSGGPERGAHPDYIPRALDASLRRLGTEWVDLYQLHTPDPAVPIADTLGALDRLVEAGKIREIGCSNFSVEQLAEADATRTPNAVRFASVQNELSLVERDEAPVAAACARAGRAFLPYYPLASGLLTGKYRRGQPAPAGTRIAPGSRYEGLLDEPHLDLVERLVGYAESRGRTLLELAFAWLLAHPAVASVIAGATRPEQVRSNADAAAWRLSATEREDVDDLLARTTT